MTRSTRLLNAFAIIGGIALAIPAFAQSGSRGMMGNDGSMGDMGHGGMMQGRGGMMGGGMMRQGMSAGCGQMMQGMQGGGSGRPNEQWKHATPDSDRG